MLNAMNSRNAGKSFLQISFFFLLVTQICFTQWVQTNLNQSTVNCFAVSGGNLFAGTDNGIFLSTDNGANWNAVNAGLTSTVVYALAVSETNLFAGTRGAGVFRSTNNGVLWTPANLGLPDTAVYCLDGNGTNLFAGTNWGVWRSTNNGEMWMPANSNILFPILSLLINGGNLFAGALVDETFNGGIYVSTNNGSSWSLCDGSLENGFSALIASGSNLYAGATFMTTVSLGGVFRSTNSGTNWTQIDSGLYKWGASSFAVSGTSLFVGRTAPGGVFLTTNNGIHWDSVSTGLGGNGVRSLAVVGTDLFTGTAGSGVWRRPLSEMITDIEDERNNLPESFSLQQNYPNPFNPITTISWQLAEGSDAALKVYDILGREIATLVNEYRPAGKYETEFNAASLPSRVYFYQLKAGSFIETKKMLLLK